MPVIGTITSYVSPIGFHNYACDFAHWAERAHDEGSKFFSPVPFYLYCRSIELALKAFLLASGLPKAQLKQRHLGHDLVKVLTKARELGLNNLVTIEPAAEAVLVAANEPYAKKDFEYYNVGFGFHSESALPVLRALSTQLRQATRQLCLDAADQPVPPPLTSGAGKNAT